MSLIPVFAGTIANETTQLVNARVLHSFLEVNKKFSDWIKDRIKQYDFIENQDFILISQNRETRTGGTVVKDYHITLDMAKELSMVERNDQGKQARRYFIDCEKQLHQAKPNGLKALPHTTLTLSEFEQYQQDLEQSVTQLLAHTQVVISGADYLAYRASNPPIPETRKRRNWTATEKLQVLARAANGENSKQIAKAIGRSSGSVRELLTRQNRQGGAA